MKADREMTVARALIQRHGLQAAAVAQEHAQQSTATNDGEGATDWRGVVRAVNQLRAESRAA
jgi:hypothetical protein